jgi:iron complex outermembrane receptor protein
MTALESEASALSHEDIAKRLPEKVDRVTIYRILQGFYEEGKVHKITGEDGKTYYALCESCSEGHHHDNHPHFRCIRCKRITCLKEPIDMPALPEGYTATSVSFLISGLCASCRKAAKIACALAFALLPFGLKAQSKATKALEKQEQKYILTQKDTIHEDLPEVVLSVPGSKLQNETVTNVVKLSLINNPLMPGTSLAEKLASIPGVSNWSTGQGIGKPVVRGLTGSRVAIFSQGVRIENQQWGDEHGLGLDENGYGHVEVIKGPASLLYGSEALGGVIYFADEGFAAANSINANVATGFDTNSAGSRSTGAFRLSKDRFHWNAFGSYTNHEDYKDGNGRQVNNSRFHTGDFKTAFGYTSPTFNSTLRYNFLKENYGLTEEENVDLHIPNGRQLGLPYQPLTTHILSTENTIYFSNFSRLKIEAGYVFNNRKELEDSWTPDLDMNLGTVSYNAKWYSPTMFKKWDLIVGSQGMYQKNTNHGTELLIPNARTSDLGVFAVSNLHYNDAAYWQAGLRFDGRHIHGEAHGSEGEDGYFPEFAKSYTAFNFSTGIFQPVNSRSSVRVNLSSGYRTPDMFELLSDGVHDGTNRFEKGDSKLKTENSYQLDAAYNYNTTHLDFYVNPYFNYIRDYIYVQPTNEEREGYQVYDYMQDNARLLGGEAGFHFHPHPWDWLHLDGSYSDTFGSKTNGGDLPLMPSQKINSTLSVTFNGKKSVRKFSAYVHELYSFAQNRVASYETTTPHYNVVNAGVDFNFAIGRHFTPLELSATVDNIFNEAYYDHLSRYKTEGIYNVGRNFNIKLSLPLNWKI